MRIPLLAAMAMAFTFGSANAEQYWVFLGTGGGKAKGIYRAEFDSDTGKVGKAELAAECSSPGFVAINPKMTHLFAVGGIMKDGKRTDGVMSFALDRKTGELKPVNSQPSVGSGPCHINCDREGKNVLIANYGGGSTTVLPIDADGKLSEASSFVQHKGSSIDKGRQSGPHAHSVNLDAAGKFAFVADLGLDKVLIYKFDSASGKITPNDPAHVETPAGGGPRHFAFHPNGKFAYVCNEMASSVTAMTYDADKGELKTVNTVTTLPKETKGNSTAEVLVHPNGKFVYVSNRGHNSIAIFSIDEKTGAVKALGHQGEGVNVPRNFNLDPTGKWMIVGNQSGDSIVVFEVDGSSGMLKPTGQKIDVPAPICVRFVPKQ